MCVETFGPAHRYCLVLGVSSRLTPQQHLAMPAPGKQPTLQSRILSLNPNPNSTPTPLFPFLPHSFPPIHKHPPCPHLIIRSDQTARTPSMNSNPTPPPIHPPPPPSPSYLPTQTYPPPHTLSHLMMQRSMRGCREAGPETMTASRKPVMSTSRFRMTQNADIRKAGLFARWSKTTSPRSPSPVIKTRLLTFTDSLECQHGTPFYKEPL